MSKRIILRSAAWQDCKGPYSRRLKTYQGLKGPATHTNPTNPTSVQADVYAKALAEAGQVKEATQKSWEYSKAQTLFKGYILPLFGASKQT